MGARARAQAFVRTYLRHSRTQPALHKIILQEASQRSERLEWLSDRHLKPLFEEVHKELVDLQQMGLAPSGNAALLFNMIRVCAGGLIALRLELLETSGIDLDKDDEIEDLANLIIRVFFPASAPPPATGSVQQGHGD